LKINLFNSSFGRFLTFVFTFSLDCNFVVVSFCLFVCLFFSFVFMLGFIFIFIFHVCLLFFVYLFCYLLVCLYRLCVGLFSHNLFNGLHFKGQNV